jgi:hypothetical protein
VANLPAHGERKLNGAGSPQSLAKEWVFAKNCGGRKCDMQIMPMFIDFYEHRMGVIEPR